MSTVSGSGLGDAGADDVGGKDAASLELGGNAPEVVWSTEAFVVF
jgi:hypothetical protein